MDSDDIVVGGNTLPPKPAPTLAERPAQESAVCGAMSQQRDHLSNQSAPQKFVHLVGCCDAKARSANKR
jgi:hypothetical protein